jgi:DNA processing protein
VTDSFYFNIRLLLTVEGIGPVKLRNVLNTFQNPDELEHIGTRELCAIEGINVELAKRIKSVFRKKDEFYESLSIETEKLFNIGARYITYWDDAFPAVLRNIYDPPLVIYVLGDISLDDEKAIAVVGTRIPTQYGKHVTAQLTEELVQSGITIVSGLARGIDTVAHRTAVQNNGRTIAVLGSGVDVIYPSENKRLSEDILKNGALISEFPFGTFPDAPNFPKRNRIISGLSRGVVVVETGLTGGAMITAKLALDQGREVFAVPGNIGVRQSEGTLSLIQRGEAKLVVNTNDILIEIGAQQTSGSESLEKNKMLNSLNLFEQKLFQALTVEPTQIDTIAAVTSLSVSDCLVYLLSLEFKGLIKQLPGKMFVLA